MEINMGIFIFEVLNQNSEGLSLVSVCLCVPFLSTYIFNLFIFCHCILLSEQVLLAFVSDK